MKPCKWGHTTGRYSDGTCIACKKARYKANFDAIRKKTKAYYEANRDTFRAQRRRQLGIVDPPSEMNVDPCTLCGRLPKPGHSNCCDHDHATGRFRGWLCHRCNRAIGLLGDSIELLEKAAQYLRDSKRRAA